MEKIRNSLVFRRLPLECVEMAFQRMKEIVVPAGQEVIRQGDDGDAFYIIISGRAEVWQRGVYDDAQHKMAELSEGDAFGCEALISGQCRSETVRIIEEATLLVLDKSDFEWLISKQLIKTVNHKIARTMLESGYKIIDVRYPEEYDEYHVPGAILMPLFELRDRMQGTRPRSALHRLLPWRRPQRGGLHEAESEQFRCPVVGRRDSRLAVRNRKPVSEGGCPDGFNARSGDASLESRRRLSLQPHHQFAVQLWTRALRRKSCARFFCPHSTSIAATARGSI